MKKYGWLGLLTLSLWLGWASMAFGANVPVYIDGAYYENDQWQGAKGEYRLLCRGEEKGGVSSVPLRAVFEACGAEVSWNEAGQVITAKVRYNQTLVMTVGSKSAKLWQAADPERNSPAGQVSFSLDAAPYLRQGKVYVPLRFVAESLGCGVNWANDSKGRPGVYLKQNKVDSVVLGDKIYRLDKYSGWLTESDGKNSRALGQVDLSYFKDWGESNYGLSIYELKKTPGGNYLVNINGTLSGALTYDLRVDSWLAPEQQLGCTVLEWGLIGNKQCSFWVEYADGGRELCLSGGEATHFIDDEKGELRQSFSGGDFHWANREWILQGDDSKWILTSRIDGRQRDLGPLLLSAENKAKMDDMVRPYLNVFGPTDYDDRVKKLFWDNIDNDYTPDAKPYIRFIREEGGVLYFELRAGMGYGYSDEIREAMVVPIEIAL